MPDHQDVLHQPCPAGRILGPDGHQFDIPPEGSLGLLAVGAAGLLAWRQRRGKIESSFVKIEPAKRRQGNAGQGQQRDRRKAAAQKGRKEGANGPQAGQ